MQRKTFTAALIAGAIASLTLALPASAQTAYPTKPGKLMVGAGPGGGTDIIARLLAEKFAEGMKGT
ncbi:MAG: tripartite tricarboxylate transporter substrate binding protein, partial [Rubrivivax sp.]